MKKNYVFIVLLVFLSANVNAQLGTTFFPIGADVGSSYGGTWADGSDQGTGFASWSLSISGSGGHYLGTTGQGTNSFGLFAGGSGGGNSATADRNFDATLQMGDRFSVDIGHSTNVASGGQVFLQLLDDGAAVITLKFVGGESNWQLNDGGTDFSIAQGYSASTSLSFTFTYNEDGTYSYTFGAASGNNFVPTSTISGINGIRFSSDNQGAGENFGVNNLAIDSKYTVTNSSSTNVTSDLTAPFLTVESGSSVTVNTGFGLTVTGNLSNSGTVTANSGSSLIVGGTSSGNITYNRTIGTTNWYLISSPVVGQDIDLFASTEGLATGDIDADNRGLGDYNNATPGWEYYQTGASGTGNFVSGDGRSLKLAASGDIAFTGTMPVADVGIAITSNTNGFNLIGNPYPSFIPGNDPADGNSANDDDILSVNLASLTEQTLWMWNQATSSYDQVNQATAGKFIAPGQGFFVSSNGSNTFNFTEAMQSHQSTGTFQRTSTTRPEINLVMSVGSSTRDADIFYIDGTTTGFDNGYDSSIFGGVVNELAIYTQAVANGTGKNLGIQSLPDNDYENMVIPVGVIATNGAEITIAVNATNLPAGINVYLEDKDDSSFTLLDGSSNFTTTLTSDLNGIGRFYIHTSSSALSIDDVNLENISIYTSNNNNIRIVGVQSGNAQVKIYNILGKQVLNSSFEGSGVNDITLPNVRAGVYIIQLETENGTLNKKVIIE
tara:strand:- start:29350 stop:31515 length:2166 start_codon:yes stop_codon:yes gene_type:complete